MFSNIGSKIKSYAKVIFWIGAVISILVGIVVIFIGIASGTSAFGSVDIGRVFLGIIAGILVAIIGVILSWINVLVLYGFGVLVENTDTLKQLQQINKIDESDDSTME